MHMQIQYINYSLYLPYMFGAKLFCGKKRKKKKKKKHKLIFFSIEWIFIFYGRSRNAGFLFIIEMQNPQEDEILLLQTHILKKCL